ncbi:MAG TPA: 50S ribosomal protein L32 [Candidatus Sulfotelmatobacter sp.]|nr:50S ribosomal protein L32 [Candidatus Sulfotelmatobacter sp.]
MPQEPKKRHSRQRQGKRRAAIRLLSPKSILCPNCQTPILSHRVCKNCGYYKGKEIVHIETKEEKEKKKEEV